MHRKSVRNTLVHPHIQTVTVFLFLHQGPGTAGLGQYRIVEVYGEWECGQRGGVQVRKRSTSRVESTTRLSNPFYKTIHKSKSFFGTRRQRKYMRHRNVQHEIAVNRKKGKRTLLQLELDGHGGVERECVSGVVCGCVRNLVCVWVSGVEGEWVSGVSVRFWEGVRGFSDVVTKSGVCTHRKKEKNVKIATSNNSLRGSRPCLPRRCGILISDTPLIDHLVIREFVSGRWRRPPAAWSLVRAGKLVIYSPPLKFFFWGSHPKKENTKDKTSNEQQLERMRYSNMHIPSTRLE